jgi:hypothetical protein
MVSALNIIHAAYNKTIHDEIESMTKSNSTGVFIYKDGSTVIPVSDIYADAASAKILPKISMEVEGRPNNINYERLEHFNSNVKILRNQNIHSAVVILEELMKKKLIYGAILHKGDFRINPFHPVIAYMIALGEITIPEDFSIIIYGNVERTFHEQRDEDRISEYQSEILKIVTNVIQGRTPPKIKVSVTTTPIEAFNAFLINPDEAVITYTESTENMNKIFIPVQLATYGITIPWYGLLVTKRGYGEYRSLNLFPMLSGNIGLSDDFATTCTGNLSNSMYGSLYVLNNMNLNSVYFGDVVSADYLDFAEACREVSIAPLKKFVSLRKS